MTEPMSDERTFQPNELPELSHLRELIENGQGVSRALALDMLAEVERLRAALAVADNVIETAHEQDIIAGDLLDTLRAENAAMREIVRAVAEVDDLDIIEACQYCAAEHGFTVLEHHSDCPVMIARRIVAQWDTPAE